ncbi:MAG: prephenate dehydratase [Gammaproteobacteria bacterium]|nr:prephenate dehydratase [Gammaproteobacteria bacterium]
MSEKKLKDIRERIDKLDEQLQALISERARLAEEVARVKREGGDGECYRAEREAEILRNVKARNAGPLADDTMIRLFREIISACLALQAPLKVAFLGPEGTFTQEAALKHFGFAVDTLPMGTVDEVFREVEAGTASYGVVPVENSTEGVVTHTLDMFLQSPLKICGEVSLRIHLHLLSKARRLEDIERVAAHQQALAQTREWLDAHLPRVERIPMSSNAEAARRARDETGTAALAGDGAARLYELGRLASNIEDEPYNTTRFLLIGRQAVPPSGHDKTTLLVSTHNRPGALFRLLQPLGRHGISMTRIESRPSRRGLWEYVFFIDLEGHAQDAKVARALKTLEEEATLFKVLGAYPAAID